MSDKKTSSDYFSVDVENWLQMYEQMNRIRAFEDNANDLYLSAKMPGLTHLYIGEEAVAVGICEALKKEDYITSTHRGHGHCIAKGGKLDLMFAELLGKEAGYCRGKGGSMHIADQTSGNLGANAIVGGSAGIATGAAMAASMSKSNQVAVCFFGEGALGQGLIAEVMNMAQLWHLPVIYVCENNLYNQYTHMSETTAGTITGRAKAFDIETVIVDGQDVREVFLAAQPLIERARRGEGPAFIQCNTYRFMGHHIGDIQRESYRPKKEEELWRTTRDPINNLGDWLIAENRVDQDILSKIQLQVRQEAEEAVEFALNAPYPALEEVDLHVYA